MSTERKITKAKAFNASDITYREAVVNKRGGKNVQIQLGGQPLVLQIPLMFNWGVNERVDEQTGRVSYDMALQFNDDSPSVLKFLEALKVMENKIKEDSCGEMCKSWHGKSKMSREVIDALMYPILKYPQKKDAQGKPNGEPDYSRYPSMKIKIPYWDGKFNCEVYDMKRQPLYLPSYTDSSSTPVTAIPKASHVNGLIQCTGMWFAGGKCGVTWKLVQACVRPPARLLGTGTCHIMDDSDDEEAENLLKQKEETNKEEAEYTAYGEEEELSEKEDEEEPEEEPEDEPEDEPEEEPVKKKKKKVVRRKKKSSD
jgi:hypothetical protein